MPGSARASAATAGVRFGSPRFPSRSTPLPGKRRALCCECGTLRTCGARYYPRNRTSEVAEEGRTLGDLKCTMCGTTTRHALPRDHEPEDYRNNAEHTDHARFLPREIDPRHMRAWYELVDKMLDLARKLLLEP
jgi:hypothetical protein